MAWDKGPKVLLVASSLEATAEEPGHRTNCAGKKTDGGTMEDEETRMWENLWITAGYRKVNSWAGKVGELLQVEPIGRA